LGGKEICCWESLEESNGRSAGVTLADWGGFLGSCSTQMLSVREVRRGFSEKPAKKKKGKKRERTTASQHEVRHVLATSRQVTAEGDP